MERKVVWQDSAIADYNAIADFLLTIWNEKVLADLNILLNQKTDFLLNNPDAGKLVEDYNQLRSVVVHRRTLLYYYFDGDREQINIVTRQNPQKPLY